MKSSVRSLVLSALMTALICLFSPVSFPVGITAVTLQTFIVALTGYILRPRSALLSVCAYLLLGACGLPVFSGFSGGIGVLTGPTGGFLAGFPVMALLVSLFSGKSRAFRLLGGLAGLCAVYVLGSVQMAFSANLSFWQAALSGVAPFIIKDSLSLLGAEYLSRAITRRLPYRAE